MRALDPEVFDPVWTATEALLPRRSETHPLGCHRRRAPDRLCFRGILIRLVTGCSWTTVEALLDGAVSDTTLRARRDEWIAAGVFETLAAEALAAYDRIIGLDLDDVAIDGSQHKAPCGGEGTGVNPVDKRKLGWKWSIATDRHGIPFAYAFEGANRHDMILLEPTLADAARQGFLAEVGTLHLDRGYDYRRTHDICTAYGITEVVCPKKNRPGRGRVKMIPLGLRWPVERTNSWLAYYRQLGRNTDRRNNHRRAQFQLAIVFILTAKLVDWQQRWNQPDTPIR
jgi:transposase